MDELLKFVSLPLQMNDIKHLYQGRDTTKFVINYSTSSLKGKGLLFYISNLEMNAELRFLDTPTEEKLSVLKEYMTISNLCNIDSLNYATAVLLLKAKGIDTVNMVQNLPFTDDELDKFITQERELIDRWKLFVDSLFVYTLYIIKQGGSLPSNVENMEFKVIDDLTYIGNNFINLFKIPCFLEMYFSAPIDVNELKFFKHQFTEYCFKGQSLFSYFMIETNWLVAMVLTLLDNASKDSSGNTNSTPAE